MDGLNDSGIHHFTEASIVSMTREVKQDSLEAAISKTQPVIVKFGATSIRATFATHCLSHAALSNHL